MKIAYITSWHWEGAFVLNALLERDIKVECLIIQEKWWKKFTVFGYSPKYWFRYLLSELLGMYDRRYKVLHAIRKRHPMRTYFIKNINNELKLLEELNPDVIVIVGSRIIERGIIQRFENKILNFHTGILPNYRGPYSEFWAIYNRDYQNIGTTIHYLDEGIDTGSVLARSYLRDSYLNPEDCHIKNTKQGAQILAEVINKIEARTIIPATQDDTMAHYYSYPEEGKIKELQEGLNMKFNIDFAE